MRVAKRDFAWPGQTRTTVMTIECILPRTRSENNSSINSHARGNGAKRRFGRKPVARVLIPLGYLLPGN